MAREAHGVFRGQSQRRYDFRKGIIIGKNDHLVCWKKPIKPSWMDQKSYDNHPDRIQVREFKVAGKVYVTTLLAHKKYHKKEIAELYKLRWQIEINLNSIKTILNMNFLSCKSPEMIRKEIGIHFLAYNFIRIMIAEACSKYDAIPNQVSFKGTLQLLNQFMPYFLIQNKSNKNELYEQLLKRIVRNKIGNRPGRIEPRAVKRRKKPFPTLNHSRSVERGKLIKQQARKYAWA
jgi:hypothetical protein